MDHYHQPPADGSQQKIITMIETPRYTANSEYLFSCFYTNANKNSPEFTTKYKSTEQLVEINFTILILRLHQEGLTEILKLANNFQQKMEGVSQAAGKTNAGDRIASAGPPLTTIEEEDEDEDGAQAKTPVSKGTSTFDSSCLISALN